MPISYSFDTVIPHAGEKDSMPVFVNGRIWWIVSPAYVPTSDEQVILTDHGRAVRKVDPAPANVAPAPAGASR